MQAILEHNPPGVAVGGLSMGESPAEMHELAAFTASLVPDEKPRYLMGVGTPDDIRRAVAAGYDLFDCVLPTRHGRTGWAFTSEGVIKIRRREYAEDDRPLDPACSCQACKTFTRAYIRHCLMVDEVIGIRMMSYHNVWHYMREMEKIRSAIEAKPAGVREE